MHKATHKRRHKELLKMLDELSADFISHEGIIFKKTGPNSIMGRDVMDLFRFAVAQAENPTTPPNCRETINDVTHRPHKKRS